MANKKILFLALHRPDRSPSQRFRFEQYFTFLESHGFACRLSYVISAKDDRYFYRSGQVIRKAFIIFKGIVKRWMELHSARKPDIVFVQREALNIGTTYFERAWKRKGIPLIFDFDDSVWLPNVSEANKKFAGLKDAGKTKKLIAISDRVIAGNQFLADYAKNYNDQVSIIPTTIDTSYHIKNPEKRKEKRICIGWTGTSTTIKHFELALPILIKIKEKYANQVYFKVIGEDDYINDELEIRGVKWDINTEIDDLSELDIGIMPLPNDEWAKGKCGFKGLQYMALGIPAVMSPVGVNTEIIEDGVNGLLVSTETEWLEKLSLLIEDAALRERLGRAGRQTVVDRFSVASQKERYLDIFRSVLSVNNSSC